MKIGVNINIDVTKIDKARIIAGKNGAKYVDLVAFIDIDQQNEYGNNGSITQQCTKEERESKVLMPFIGNVKVFYKAGEQNQQARAKPSPMADVPRSGRNQAEEFGDSHIPF